MGNWTPDYPIAFLPEDIRRRFSEKARDLLRELKKYKLEVTLISAPDPHFESHMIRRAIKHNPSWWGELYWNSRRSLERPRCLKRSRAYKALTRIIRMRDGIFIERPREKYAFRRFQYSYDPLFRGLVLEMLIHGRLDLSNGYHHQPDDRVRAYLGMPPLKERFVSDVKEMETHRSSKLDEENYPYPDFDDPNSPFYWPIRKNGRNPFEHYSLEEDS